METLPRIDPIRELPIVILCPHSRCNCRCVMCDIWRAKGKQEIAVEVVARWVTEWRRLGVRQVGLSGGEPLLHSDLWRLCEAVQQAGMTITLLSTGLLLARDAEPLARYCADVIVSLDGPREVHNRIRNVPGAYGRLAAGVAAVRQANPRATITGRCTVQRLNYHALRATVAAAHELGLDRISFLAADVHSEAFHQPGGWDRERMGAVALHEADLPLLAAELEQLVAEYREDFAGGFISETPEKLRQRLHQYYAALWGHGDFAPNRCNAPWVSTVIEADGTVRPCFFQPPLGNLFAAGGLDAVLNAPQAVAWRRTLDVRRNAICRTCVCTLSWQAGTCSASPAAARRERVSFSVEAPTQC